MILIKTFIKLQTGFLVIAFMTLSALSQKQDATTESKQVLWEPVNIAERDLFNGPGGQTMQPALKEIQFFGRQTGGTQIKYRLKDGAGKEWVVKVGRETQPETAAVRLLWAIGYPTEINYLVPSLEIKGSGNGAGIYKNARFEARPDNIKRGDKWSWTSNPFVGTNEFEGLKLMMAIFNNWDIKDENTAILNDGSAQYYIISDLGATFGKVPKESGGKSGRTVNKPEQYAQSKFIRQVRDDVIELDYRGKADNIIKTAKVEHGRWLADLLLQLSDRQIEDSFRAANYEPEDVKLLAQAFKARIAELDAATKPAETTGTTETKQTEQ
ncbi:MAG TPA: hypothetical protein VGC97_18195 [Pyrinomonadaceae bacterium]|jgi:hypothetical protein